MKSSKGITLISLIIYIIVLLIAIGTMSLLSSFLYKNLNEIMSTNDISQQYIYFMSYLSGDINSRKSRHRKYKYNRE